MTVNIDPSEVRRNGASVKPSPRAARFRVPLRAVLIGGLGSAGLIAFTVGAFSFFSGLADPRIRSPRTMPVAAKMPDLKDGIPALAPETGPAAAPQATTYNLPHPASVQPQPIQSAQEAEQKAEIEPPVPQLRMEASAEPIVAEPRRDAGMAAPAVDKPREGVRAAKAAPPIQNAAVIAETPRTAALVPPAKAETVKAKPGQPSAFASLPAESRPDAKPHREPETSAQEARKPAAKPPTQKTAAHKLGKPKSTADAASMPDQAAPAAAEDGDAIPGTRQVRAGLKAIGGMLGISDSD